VQNEPQPRHYDTDDEGLKQNRINIGPATDPFANERGHGHCNEHEDDRYGQDDRPDLDNTRHGLRRFWR